jgi:hypothetical protein
MKHLYISLKLFNDIIFLFDNIFQFFDTNFIRPMLIAMIFYHNFLSFSRQSQSRYTF